MILKSLIAILFSATISLASPMKIVWTINADTPESVYFDPESQNIFVSNIVGKPDEKDGKGWISKLDANGKLISQKWVDGIDAPKGLRAYKGTLWVTNINEVIAIDIAAGKIKHRFDAEGSKFLNDIGIADDGRVFISDTFGGKIYEINDEKVSVFMEGSELEAPNGLFVDGNDLVVAGFGIPDANWFTKVPGRLFKINLATKKKTLITKKSLGNLDGLEKLPNGSFLVSDWKASKIYTVTSAGKIKTLNATCQNTADIGFQNQQRIILMPCMSANKIEAVLFTE